MDRKEPATLSPPQPVQKKYQREWSLETTQAVFQAARDYCAVHRKVLDILQLADYGAISPQFAKTPEQCMLKVREVLISGSTRAGVWCSAEDELFIRLVEENMSWRRIVKQLNAQIHAGLKVRNSKHCRERWSNHLDPAINRGPWTPFEDFRLMKLHLKFGNSWREVAERLRDRSGTAVKNRVNSLVRKERHGKELSSSDAAKYIVARLQGEVADNAIYQVIN